jgi:galactokinase
MPSEQNVSLFVPGRLCLFGEHSDWAAEYGLHKGYCLVVGTDQGLSAVASRSDEFSVQSPVPNGNGATAGHRHRRMTCDFSGDTLLEAARDRDEFFRYCAGVAYQMRSRQGVTGGIDLRITGMDLPLRKGVSSSAAVCVLVALAFDAVYDLGLFPQELMEIGYLGEKLTGSECGRMDQACIYGKTPVLLTFFKDGNPRVEPIVPAGRIDMLFVDLAGEKDTVRILDDLRGAFAGSRDIQHALGPGNERLVRQAHAALRRGDARMLGEIMTLAQEQFDRCVAPHSPQQLKSPLLHELLALPELAELTFGGKGVGSQGDGTAQFVARSARARDAAMARISEVFPQMACFPLTIVGQAAVGSAAPPPGAQPPGVIAPAVGQ